MSNKLHPARLSIYPGMLIALFVSIRAASTWMPTASSFGDFFTVMVMLFAVFITCTALGGFAFYLLVKGIGAILKKTDTFKDIDL